MDTPSIPRLGLGTGGGTYPNDDEVTEAVTAALNIGFRHIDTAPMYGNQTAVGSGIERSDVPRHEIFLSSKVSPENLGYDDVIESVEKSLDRLNVNRLDVLYVHFPTGKYSPSDTFTAFNELYEADIIDAVGVSNFTPAQLDTAREHVDSGILANQIEMHPWCHQEDLIAYARKYGITLVAYCPLIRGKIFDEPVVRDIAEDHDFSPAQVSLAWLLAKDDVCVITKSTNPTHLRENFAALKLSLTAEDIARIDAIERTEKLVDTTRT